MTFRRHLPLVLVLAALPHPVRAQIIVDTAATTRATDGSGMELTADAGRRAQAEFESFRRLHLPSATARPPATCDEQVGRFCYWYDEKAPPAPREPALITERRNQLIAQLDTLARRSPDDRWVSGQRVRYLAEAERFADALKAAKECGVGGWWCGILEGFSLHLLGSYRAADSVYSAAIAQMLPSDRCEWRSIELLIDDDARQQYRRFPCEDPRRRAYEDRAWFFARTLYSMNGNDSRTEYFARMTMVMMLRDAPSLYENGFDDDERELLLRFGWPRAWAAASSGSRPGSMGIGMGYPGGRGGMGPRGRGGVGGGMDPRDGDGRGGASAGPSIVSHEPTPAYRYVPAGFVLNDPTNSDSSAWRLQLPPVIARYAPPYAVVLKPLEHQKAMFKRGDSALVVLAYDSRSTKELDGAKMDAALVITPSDVPRNYGMRMPNAPATGVLMAKAPWGPMLMSAEVAAPDRRAVARARYGIAMPFAVGARVTLSELLFFKPYGSFPSSVEEAAPHALPTELLHADQKLGVYWESYGTDPAGERMHISLTVMKEQEESGFFRREAKALRLVREATPVTVSVEDFSARASNVSPRALELDISTLKKGSYVVQLEVEVAGQYVVRAEHRIEVVGP